MRKVLARYLLPSLLCALVGFVVGGMIGPATLEDWLADRRMGLVARGERDPRIVVVGVDPRSLEEIGPWPWSRGVHGQLVETVHQGGGRALFFDFLFEEAGSDPEGDRRLASALRAFGRGYVSSAVRDETRSGTGGGLVPSPVYPPFAEAADVVLINRRLDPDGMLRWGILGLKPSEGPILPAAALAMFADHQGVPQESLEFAPDEGSIRVGSLTIPTSGFRPNEIPIVFRRAPAPVSYADALSGKVDFRDKLVLVGDASSDAQDTFVTSVGKLKGIEGHAAILDTLLQGPYVRAASRTENLAVTFLLCLAVTVLAHRFTRPSGGLAAAAAVMVLYVPVNLVLFASGVWLELVSPLLGGVLSLGAAWAVRNREARQLFGQFVAGQKVDAMLASDRAASLGTREQVVTIFFTDIRGYTTLSETRSPVEVMDMLNEYHTRAYEVYSRRGGTVMTYQGDAQIVVFGYTESGRTISSADAVLCAVQAGLELQAAVEELRKRWTMKPNERFEVGVGICTGSAEVGNVGSAGHMQFTVLGDLVRFASDVQGFSAALDAPVILDGPSRAAAGERVKVDELEPVAIKSQPEPVVLYRATAVRSGPGARAGTAS